MTGGYSEHSEGRIRNDPKCVKISGAHRGADGEALVETILLATSDSS